MKGDNNTEKLKTDDKNKYKYTPKIKETQIKIIPTYREGLQEWIEWKILYYNNMGFNHVKWIIRNKNLPTEDNVSAIQISESHFWKLTMALQDTSLSEVIRSYETSGPAGTADGWGADKSIHIAMETEDSNNVLAVALSHQIDKLRFKKYDDNIQIHISNFNKIMAQIKDRSPSFYPPYVILNRFMQSIKNNTYNTLKTLAISQN